MKSAKAAMAAVLSLCVLTQAQAGAYLVCYLPPDVAKHVIRFCPGPSDATAGEPCRCLLRTETLTGTMTELSIPDAGAVGAGAQTMCVPPARQAAAATLCPVFRSTSDTACTCAGEAGGSPGEKYSVTMMPRIPVRTNQAAAADFLRRLQECCVSK